MHRTTPQFWQRYYDLPRACLARRHGLPRIFEGKGDGPKQEIRPRAAK